MKTFFHQMRKVGKPRFPFLVFGMMVIAFLASSGSFARNELGVRAQSFGGAYRAVAVTNDIIFYNPAGLLKNRRIGPDIDYRLSKGGKLHNLGASFIDSSTTSWGLGLAYNAAFQTQSERAVRHLAYLAVAMPIVSDMLSFGAAFSYVHDANVENDPYRHFFNMDLGVLVTLPIGLSFAVVGDHLFKPKGLEKSMGLSMGAAFDLGVLLKPVPLTLSFDWLMDEVLSKKNLDHVIGAGAEFIVFGIVPLRLGLKSELKENQQFISMGTGIVISNFALDGLYQQHLSVGKIRHFGFALRLNF